MKSSTIFRVLLIAATSSVVLTCVKQDNPLYTSNNVPKQKEERINRDTETDDVDFLLFDVDADDLIDPCEWTMTTSYHSNLSLKDFVHADEDGDDRVSLEEFLSMKSKSQGKRKDRKIWSRENSKV